MAAEDRRGLERVAAAHLAGTGLEAVHSNKKVMDMLHEEGQRAFEDRFGSREEFMKIFGKNFIMEDHKHDGH